MKKEEFIQRAEDLLEISTQIEESPASISVCFAGYDVFPGLENLTRDIVHLVYAYDGNLPLLDEIKELREKPQLFSHPAVGSSDWKGFFERLRFFIQYFIQYLKDFG